MALSNRRRSCSPPATASSLYFPPELIHEVARRLTNLQDLFALRAVCRTYRALLPLTSSNLASQALLLLVPLEDGSKALFHPTLRLIHRFRLHLMPRAGTDWRITRFRACGNRLAIYEIGGKRGYPKPSLSNLSIVSLLTGERTCLSGPPEGMSRILLCGDLVLTWKQIQRAIRYCRLEAADWRVASIVEPYKLLDLICVNGILDALVIPGYLLAAVQLSEDKNSVELVLLGGNLDAPTLHLQDLHLAECCGELILIRTMEFDPLVYHFFRWKFGEAKWERITSGLGGCTLFVADDHFVGCLGPDHKSIRGDSMYITTDNDDGNWYEYSLTDGSFNRFVVEYPGRPPLGSPLIWVLPSMS